MEKQFNTGLGPFAAVFYFNLHASTTVGGSGGECIYQDRKDLIYFTQSFPVCTD